MRLFLICLTLMTPAILRADPLVIVTDIAPIHSLVVQVAGPDAEVSVLVSGGASPHDFQFSFSQADALQSADLVVWTGKGLTPWLDEALETLAPDTTQLALLETEGWPSLARRDWDDGHEHGDDDHDAHDEHAEGDHDEDEHDDHADEGHDDHAENDHGEDGHDDHADDGHDDHADDEHADDGHDDHAHEGAVDPHAWLDPQVAIAWADTIMQALITQDPENEATYRENAAALISALTALDQDLAQRLNDLPDAPLLVPHDAYQYFGARYGVQASAAIALSDATAPSPAKIAELQDIVADMGVMCVLSDPQSRSAWVDLVREGTAARTALADPIGNTIDIGPNHYDQTLRALADAYVDCLAG